MSHSMDGWVEKSPMMDGSGTYRCCGVVYKVFVQDLISTKHRVATLDGVEVARAAKFTTLLRRLKALDTPDAHP